MATQHRELYPIHPMTAVSVTLAKAVISGLLTSSVIVSVTTFLAVTLHWSFLIPVSVGFLAFSITTSVQWLRLARPEIVYVAPETPAPVASETPELRITVHTKGPGNTGDNAEPGDVIETFGLHIKPDLLTAIMRSCTSGAHSWSYRSLAEIPGVSQNIAHRLLDEMLESGLLQYRDGQKNHPKGHELTASGRAIARKITA